MLSRRATRYVMLSLFALTACLPINNNETDDSKQPSQKPTAMCASNSVCKEFSSAEREYCSKVEKAGKSCEANTWDKDLYGRVQAGLGQGNSEGSKVLSGSPFGFFNPMPKARVSGYIEDSGLDLMGDHFKVYAMAAGRIVYSEPGHTLWNKPPDTPNSVLIELISPIKVKGKNVTHLFYTHLSKLAFFHARDNETERFVKAGEYLGVSGLGGGSPHLHLGLLLDNQVGQEDGTFLNYLEIRDTLGTFKTDDLLPD